MDDRTGERSMTGPTAIALGRIGPLVARIRENRPDARVIGVRSRQPWGGAEYVTQNGDRLRVLQCDSPIAFRKALHEADPSVAATVLITPLDDRSLGEDIRVRLAGRKLHAVDPWHIVGLLFRVRRIDPRVTGSGWIADRLIDLAPPEGYPPVLSGVLDAETVWEILLTRDLGLGTGRPDLAALLDWSRTETNVSRWRAADDPFREEAAAWIIRSAGAAALAVLNCVKASPEPLALPAGLALGVIHAENRPSAAPLDKAAGRLEQLTGNAEFSAEVAARWYAAAREVVLKSAFDANERHAWLTKSDALLADLGADEFAYLSDVSPIGFEQRLARFGAALDKALTQKPVRVEPDLLDAVDLVFRHCEAEDRRSRRLERVTMAVRLLRWLGRETEKKGDGYADFSQAAADYVRHGGFVDWARTVVAGGEPVKALSRAYGRLAEAVARLREMQNHAFARLLRDWTLADSTGDKVRCIEQVMDDIVVPLVAEKPMLIILIDGMSHAVFRELLADITAREWAELVRADGSALPPVVAAIPSLTRFSRTGFFAGKRGKGVASDEVKALAKHPGLKNVIGNPSGAVLFHKVDVTDAMDGSLSQNVRDAVAAPGTRRLVAVVLNAVDDHLEKGDQTDPRWTAEFIRALPALLYEARSAGRLVMLASDHGHVLERGTRRKPDGQESRWRSPTPPAGEGEMHISGSRVMGAGADGLIGLWSEQYRYGAKKNGYHGGLTPQEMLAPLAVLFADETPPDGWRIYPRYVPAWWEALEPAQEQPAETEAVAAPVPEPPSGSQLGLFERVSSASKPSKLAKSAESAASPTAAPDSALDSGQGGDAGWIGRLIGSPVYDLQKSMAGRAAVGDETIAAFLKIMARKGGRISADTLARALALPAFRLQGWIAKAGRLLNVDGYAIVSRDDASGAILLDIDLLKRQFELDGD